MLQGDEDRPAPLSKQAPRMPGRRSSKRDRHRRESGRVVGCDVDAIQQTPHQTGQSIGSAEPGCNTPKPDRYSLADHHADDLRARRPKPCESRSPSCAVPPSTQSRRTPLPLPSPEPPPANVPRRNKLKRRAEKEAVSACSRLSTSYTGCAGSIPAMLLRIVGAIPSGSPDGRFGPPSSVSPTPGSSNTVGIFPDRGRHRVWNISSSRQLQRHAPAGQGTNPFAERVFSPNARRAMVSLMIVDVIGVDGGKPTPLH